MQRRRYVIMFVRVSVMLVIAAMMGGCVDSENADYAPAPDAIVGETEVADDFAMRLIGASVTNTVAGPPPATSGYRYLVLEIELERRGDTAATYSENGFLVSCNEHSSGLAGPLEKGRAFGTGTLSPGERRHGFVAFLVDDSGYDFMVRYRTRPLEPVADLSVMVWRMT